MNLKDLKPTRAELLILQKKITIAQEGHRLLKLKRDVLILELKKVAKESRRVRMVLESEYRNARGVLSIALMMEGYIGLSFVAASIDEVPEVIPTTRNVMGVKVPVFSSRGVKSDLLDRGYGLIDTSSVIDESVEAFENLLEIVIQCAENEAVLRRLINEIVILKRRVNALEHRVIPDLVEARNRIFLQHEELEHEELSRIFWLKKRFVGHYEKY